MVELLVGGIIVAVSLVLTGLWLANVWIFLGGFGLSWLCVAGFSNSALRHD